MEIKEEKELNVFKYASIKQESEEDISSEIQIKPSRTVSETKQESNEIIQFVINEIEEERPQLEENLDSEAFPCNVCGKICKNALSLRCHIKRHTDERKHECEICKKDFRDRNSVKRHVLSVHMGKKCWEMSTVHYECDECGMEFWNRTKYERHLLKHSNVRNEECPVCSKKFKHKVYLERHMIVHSTEKPFVCEICSKTFRQEYYLKKHTNRHNKKSSKCLYCEKMFKNRDGYTSHLDMFHRGLPADIKCKSDPIACTVCKEIFKDLPSLKQHIISHPIEKPYECAICEKRYINLRRMRTHIGVAHAENRKSYKRKSRPVKEKEKPKCSICDKQFKAKKFLNNHMILHDKDRPLFPCKVCGLKLKSLSTLRRHELNHQKNNETSYFKCPGCWKTYIKRRSFNKHMESHHRDLLKISAQDETLITDIECAETIKTEPECSYEIRD